MRAMITEVTMSPLFQTITPLNDMAHIPRQVVERLSRQNGHDLPI
eukprot:gene27309-34006_t